MQKIRFIWSKDGIAEQEMRVFAFLILWNVSDQTNLKITQK